MTRLTEREIWKSVVGFESMYEVSNVGRVRSLARDVKRGSRMIRLDGYELQPGYAANDQYARVVLCRDGKMKTCKVHQLVAEAFIGPRPDGHITRHWDDNKRNNHADNLRYGTHIENAADYARNGRQLYGEDCRGAKLTEAQVVDIRASSDGPKVLGLKYGVASCTISNIRARKKWRHVA